MDSPAPALEGCILQDGTRMILARCDANHSRPLAQVCHRKERKQQAWTAKTKKHRKMS